MPGSADWCSDWDRRVVTATNVLIIIGALDSSRPMLSSIYVPGIIIKHRKLILDVQGEPPETKLRNRSYVSPHFILTCAEYGVHCNDSGIWLRCMVAENRLSWNKQRILVSTPSVPHWSLITTTHKPPSGGAKREYRLPRARLRWANAR